MTTASVMTKRAASLDDLFEPDTLSELCAGAVPTQPVSEFEGLDKSSATILSLGRRIMARPRPEVLMQDALGLLLEALNCDRALLAEAESPSMQLSVRAHAAAPGAPALSADVEKLSDHSLAASVFQSGRLECVADLAADSRFEDRALRSWGVVSAAAAPLRLVKHDFGALVLGSTQPREFAPEDLACLEAVSALLISALAHDQSERRLARSKSLLDALLENSNQVVVLLDAQGRVIELNRMCVEATGFARRELAGRAFGEALCVPKEATAVHNTLNRPRVGNVRSEFQMQLANKHGNRQAVRWVISDVQHPSVEGNCVLLIGDLARPVASGARRPSAEPARPAAAGQDRAAPAAAQAPAAGATPTAPPNNQDLRSSPRKAFPFFQRVAPYHGIEPAADDFFVARFRDISAGGMSFLLSERPNYRAVMVELGAGQEQRRLVADIVRLVDVVEDGQQFVLVGCRFVRRAD